MKKILLLLIVLCGAFFVASCTEKEVAKPTFEFDGPDTLKVGASMTYLCDVTYDGNGELTLSSSNSSVLTIDNNGNAEGVAEGSVNIIACFTTSDGSKYYANKLVKVYDDPAPVITITGDSLLYVGETGKLTINVESETSGKAKITSSNDSLLTVDESGKVTAKSSGSVRITYEYLVNNKVYDEYFVITVKDAPVLRIVGEDTLYLGDTSKYTISSNLEEALTVISSDDTILSIDASGNANALAIGTADILVSQTVDGRVFTKTFNVKVLKEKDVTAPAFVKKANFKELVELSYAKNFDAFSDIDVVDDVDGNINSSVTISGLNNLEYGTYNVVYTAKDSSGNTASFTRQVKVVWNYDVTFIGHAGSYFGNQNSYEAFEYALKNLHYTALECDLKQTKDGVFVMSHDDTFGTATIGSTTYADLKKVVKTTTRNSGYPKQYGMIQGNGVYSSTICSLEEYLQLCKQYNAEAIIELKDSVGITNSDQSRMSALMEVIKKNGMLDHVTFLGSAYNCLIWTRNNGYEDVPCQYLVNSCASETILNRCIDNHLDLSINVTGTKTDGSYYDNSSEWLARYKAAGLKISTWTFTQYCDYSQVQAWIDKGVDYVTCDWQLPEKFNLPYTDPATIVYHTVTFVDDDGTVIKEVEVKDGTTAAAPIVQDKAGKSFKAWDKDFTNVTTDLIVTATYTLKDYTITFVGNAEKVTESSWASKAEFVNEFYTDLYNWLKIKNDLDGITVSGDSITVTKNGTTATFSSVSELLAVNVYDFEKTVSNYIYAPVTRNADDTCDILPNENYFLNSSNYLKKYYAVDAYLMKAINTAYTSYSKTYVPTSAGKIQIFFRFHQWANGTNIAAFNTLPVKYDVVHDTTVSVPSPMVYNIESEITLTQATGSRTFKGWNTKSDGTGTYYTSIAKGTTGDIVLYAIWE